MNNNAQLMDMDTIKQLAKYALATMQDEEVIEAVKWLKEHVLSTNSPEVQEILFKAWLAVHDRHHYDMAFD